MLKSQVSCCHQSSPVSQIAWMIALNIAEVEKIRSENLRLRSILEANRFKFWMKATLVTVGGNLCSLWMVVLKSA